MVVNTLTYTKLITNKEGLCMRQILMVLSFALCLFFLPSMVAAQNVQLVPKVYFDFPGIGVVVPNNSSIEPSIMMSGWHITFLKKGKINFLGLGMSYNWINTPNITGKRGFEESAALSVPVSLQLGNINNDGTVYLTVSYNYSFKDSVRGHGLFIDFSVGSR